MSASKSAMNSCPIVDYNDWQPEKFKFMAPKPTATGGQAINIISSQINRTLAITTPMMTTWGISDYVPESTGVSDGKFTMNLVFPNAEYETPEMTEFLEKFKKFEQTVLEEAVVNSKAWWKKAKTLEMVEDTFFPALKYSKNKETGEIDYSRAPSIKTKIPYYKDKDTWSIKIFDVNGQPVFPSETANGRTPPELVPKFSQVACVLQCGGVWISSAGWGVNWKCVQIVVKPREIMSISDSNECFIKLSGFGAPAAPAEQSSAPVAAAPAPAPVPPKQSDVISSTIVEDSDDEGEPPAKIPAQKEEEVQPPAAVEEPAPVQAPVPAPAATEEPAAAPKVVKKTVVRKKVV